ncbi:nuclear transport factor 2 family protein [Sediminibacterium roseum]|uniref:Nuclear transport factor 2 family protein n=1 Tax=Sediminibacterium roseum TaxID=1978412 RepID=A0ABW9ZMT6_9BACT|nr:nuclear transport factor 2 family protein [Sediminibacterium roseum]NCI48374.1 nuclear transport factor 2 family protein [Sediminibacterium roseum]
MKKHLVLLSATTLLAASAYSQKTIKGLIGAERAFASFTESHTIREGFLQFLDSTGLIFSRGNAINAFEAFGKQKAGPAVLSWEPAFAIISASGELGVTTGPFTVKASVADTVSGRGNFSSVWKVNGAGDWKNMVDLGVNYTKKAGAVQQVQEIVLAKQVIPRISFSEIMEMDNKFNQAIKEKSGNILLTQLSADSWLNAEGETPVIGTNLITNFLLHIPEAIAFTPNAGGISSSGDLAYVYGTVQNGTKKENYLRVWANRNKKWRVVLQTIKW